MGDALSRCVPQVAVILFWVQSHELFSDRAMGNYFTCNISSDSLNKALLYAYFHCSVVSSLSSIKLSFSCFCAQLKLKQSLCSIIRVTCVYNMCYIASFLHTTVMTYCALTSKFLILHCSLISSGPVYKYAENCRKVFGIREDHLCYTSCLEHLKSHFLRSKKQFVWIWYNWQVPCTSGSDV